MCASKYLSIVLALIAGQCLAQETSKQPQAQASIAVPTIGQLAEQARLKRQAEDSVRSTGASQGTGAGGSAPAGMLIVPSTQIITGAAASGSASKPAGSEKKTPEKKAPPPEFIPVILGTFKRDSQHFVELGEMAGNEAFTIGKVTPSGWTILAIGSKSVKLGKVDPKSGASKTITLQVSGM
jgi:hypothetical protein